MTRDWLLLGLAIAFEIVGFYALNISDGFSRVAPTLTVFAAFFMVYWLLARIMRRLPLGIVYALWSGCTVALTSLMDLMIFGEQPAVGQTLGLGLIIAGVAWLNLSASSGQRSEATNEAL